MKKTQRLIIVLGNQDMQIKALPILEGFHACTLIRSISPEKLKNVYHYNKNAVHLAESYELDWAEYEPIIIRLTNSTNIDNKLLDANNILSDFPKILEECDVDVGDHKSSDSIKLGNHSTDNCLLCKIRDRITSKVEHILYETENFYCVPGTGAFFDGYVMIVPKMHVMSFANLPKEQIDEFWQVLDDMRTLLQNIYKKRIFAFECGSGKTGEGKHETSIVHAHFHLAPTDMPVLEEVQKSGLHPALIKKQDLTQYGEYPYMLYVDQDDNWYISSNPQEYYPRQHPRQVLANYMNCYDIYNWREFPFREKMDIIAEEFRGFCRDNLKKLNSWQKSGVRFKD